MKDRENRLRWADRLSLLLVAAMFILAVFACMGSVLCLAAMFILLVPALGVELFLNRCPHCGGWLARNRGKFCQHCGQRIREKRPDT